MNILAMSSITIGYDRCDTSRYANNEQRSSSRTINPPLASTITVEKNFRNDKFDTLSNGWYRQYLIKQFFLSFI